MTLGGRWPSFVSIRSGRAGDPSPAPRDGLLGGCRPPRASAWETHRSECRPPGPPLLFFGGSAPRSPTQATGSSATRERVLRRMVLYVATKVHNSSTGPGRARLLSKTITIQMMGPVGPKFGPTCPNNSIVMVVGPDSAEPGLLLLLCAFSRRTLPAGKPI
jgi:hypothetical protein